MSQDAEFAQHVFSSIERRERRRLATGLAMRESIHEQLENGTVPEHYRTEWLREAVLKTIDHLYVIGRDFNRAHPNDKMSSMDLLDVLVSTIRTLKNAADVQN